MINQEDIYRELQNENWKALIDVFYNRKDIIKTDILLTQSLELTLQVITEKAKTFSTEDNFIESIEQILLLDAGKFIVLKPEQTEAIKLALVNAKQNNLVYAYNYAKHYPENELCKTIIEQFERDFPKEFKHEQIMF